MSAYEVVLLVHSWLRWAVLLLGVAVFGRAWRSWRGRASLPSPALHVGFIIALDAQVALGLVLYFGLSPIPAAALQDMDAVMGDAVLRFYSLEHVFGMAAALIAAHVAFMAGRVADGRALASARSMFLAQAFWLFVTLGSIPWPGLTYGRALFRTVF